MANRYRNLIYSTAEYTQIYDGFRGVELNGSSRATSRGRFAYSQNVYKDYDGDGADVIESIPGYRQFAHYGEKINALYYQRALFGTDDHLIIHVGNRLMRHPVSDIYKENATGTEIARLEDTKSFGFEYGRYFYVMDTKRIIQISDDGVCKAIEEGDSYTYVPTTYVNGEAYEQRNLLTKDFKEEFYIADPRAYLFSSDGLRYTITDPALRYCAVKGIENHDESAIYVPAYVNIADVEYKVVSVEEKAFAGNQTVSSVYLPEGIIRICKYAFSDCKALETVVLSDTLTQIDEGAFSGCTALKTVYLGESLSVIGENAFGNCTNLANVHYALGDKDYSAINGKEVFASKTPIFNSRYETVTIFLPFYDKVNGVTAVQIDGEAKPFSSVNDTVYVRGVILKFKSAAYVTDITITIFGTFAPLGDDWLADTTTLNPVTPYNAIVNCRIAEVFDGRIFFSGNPDLPNTVFYTERADKKHDGALYVGQYNYFNDGIGSRKVNALLSVRDMLAVFKEGDDGAGSIFYHKKESVNLGAIDTIYPVAYVHSGLCSVGKCLSFLDDPVFLSSEGLMALNKENIDYQRNIVSRSHNVNYYLLKEDLSKASLCEWLGYLVVGMNGKVFLADSRAFFTHESGSREYEWFYLSDIGAYNDDKTVYRYSSDEHPSAYVHPTKTGKRADGSLVYSAADENGELYYYVQEDGVNYHVSPTAEMEGGTFFPATLFLSHEKLLIFATDDGHVCVFNNDMRGIAPDSVKNSPDYDDAIYKAEMANKLHPLFYSFVGHAPTYVMKTSLDDCGVPHLTKNTVKKSLVIKAKSETADSIICEVKTDGGDPVEVAVFPASESGFDSFDFSVAPWYNSRYVSTVLPENEKRWIEKQISLVCESFASPVSLYSITYRYTIKGKIKNNV